MPKSALIQEGGRPKKVGNLRRIITDSPNGRQPWVPQPLTNQKFISKNGMYLASNDDLDGFSKIRVNVAGGVAGMTKPTINRNGIEVVDPNTDPSVIPNYPAYVPYDGSIGNVIGVDPIDGNTYVSGLDKDGNLKKNKVPSSIRVLIPPAKTTYNVGDKILYYGLVVELLDENGQNCSNDDYPTGIISWSPVPYIVDGYKNYNLITPVENVIDSIDEYGASSDMTLPRTWTQPILVHKRVSREVWNKGRKRYEEYWRAQGNAAIIVRLNHEVGSYLSLCSDGTGTIFHGHIYATPQDGTDSEEQVDLYDRYTHSGKTVYYEQGTYTAFNFDFTNSVPYIKGKHDAWPNAAGCWTAIYGTLSCNQKIPVKWKSPYDSAIKETSFDISINME